MITVELELHQRVRAVVLSDLAAFDKRREVLRLVQEALETAGTFYRSRDTRAFFFDRVDRRLLDLEQQPFQYLLSTVSGLSATETIFKFVADRLQAEAHRAAPLVDIHTLAHWDPATGRLMISDGGGGLWVHEEGDEWRSAHNGDGGLFLTDADATPWIPEFGANGHSLQWFLDGFLFGDGDDLSRQDQQTLLLMFLLQQFFPARRRTRVVPALLGPQGSGKTTGQRRTGHLLIGPRFDVTALHRDREDAFVAAVTNRTVCAIDNADSRVNWLPDALATYATGTRYRMRRLYTTNDEVSYEPRAVLMLSSRDPQFNRPDVAERLLPFRFERPTRYEPEGPLFDALAARRGAIWGQLLLRLGQIADGLAETPCPRLQFRMADFATFGWAVSRISTGDATEWERLLGRLERAQAEFASDGDGLVEALRVLLEREGSIGPIAIADFFKRAAQVAEEEHLPFPRNAIGFGKKLSSMRRVLEVELAVRLHEQRGLGRRRTVTLTPKPTRAGEGRDGREGVSETVSKSRTEP